MQKERERTRYSLQGGRMAARRYRRAEQWPGSYKVLQQWHPPKFFHFAPSPGDCAPQTRLWRSALAAFAVTLATSVTTQSAGEALLLLFAMASRGHTSLPRMNPRQNLRHASRDCQFSLLPRGGDNHEVLASPLSAAKSLPAQICCQDRQATG